jgi:acyl-coenzyme A synthetase/AMP-(fatty) acid ligase
MSAVPGLRVANLYGPTEATVACAAYELNAPPAEDEDAIPFGWRTAGTEVTVWTNDNRVANLGECGEVFIAGDQVGPGYLGDPAETSRRFVADPRGTGLPAFRTGDIATVREGGPVFNSRIDNQIKFRGWRIELGDIERALAAVAGTLECATSLIKRDGKADALVAFVRVAANITTADILARLRETLPAHMIPTHVRIVQDFPRTLNQKIDRARLAELF